ncbi:hypothetical protein G7047_18785 [Diaphorobacter sp. HDW4A]|uniref:hypothetical protein n=1 Tax=Diaphorobacter sp. HDW4A TaxID=2714924 RepID=UPI001408908F|nr:hypothetical protein [Diaphorobacter sp. HDW4A]QIL81733.1 hypothetical protein G7047_18785 [Diaphorobacter sp. HDW4A]
MGSWTSLLIFWALLGTVYLGWLVVFWPGVLGEDSAAILMEVDGDGEFRSGKSVLWYYFVKWTYGPTHLVEVPIAILMLLCAFFFARMLAWYWDQKRHGLCLFLLIYICAAPHMVYFAGTLYPDAIFAVAATALLFEIWILCSERWVSWLSLCVFTIALPFAVFVRPNGIIFLVPALLALLFVHGKSRHLLTAVLGLWCAAIYAGAHFHHSTTQSATRSLVLFETVKLMQPRAMNEFWQKMPDMNDPWVLREPKLTPRTLEILEGRLPGKRLSDFSDPVYWDMRVFDPVGPQLLTLPEAQAEELEHEFFHHNLWQNLPDVIASRVNVFLSATLAQGGFPALNYSPYVLRRITATSQMRRFGMSTAEQMLRTVHRLSYGWRWLLWAPWLGLGLLMLVALQGTRRKDGSALLICIPTILQLFAIFAFASAGEYRYLLLFFTRPLALFPVYFRMRNT